MEVFDIQVNLHTDDVHLFVVPFEIQSTPPTMGYLLVRNEVGLGSIFLDTNYQWITRDLLPWDSDDLQRIGEAIENVYFAIKTASDSHTYSKI